jgi:hypothetical protein
VSGIVAVPSGSGVMAVPAAYGTQGEIGPAGTSVISGIAWTTPQQHGAVGDGVTDDSAAFVAALAALKLYALNTGGGGFYKGSPKLFIPAGHYFLNTTALDIFHTLIIEGEGSGQLGPEAFGCSRLRWAAGTDGIRIQAANTSGSTTVDGSTHDGAGGVVLRDLCLEGGFAGTEGDYHGLVVRNAVKAERLYIKNWQGEGVKAWAGTVTGFGNVAGNVSTMLLEAVKVESCRGGIDIRGTGANIVTTINCEGYNCRWFGILDDNGAGANVHIGPHCASNGSITGTWPQTQCSYSGNRYAAKWGGDPTVAPSGTTADSANWFYIEAGGAVAGVIPAWVSTPNTFRAGGDYVTLNNAGVLLVNPYSENGGFSQFNPYTRIDFGTLPPKYFRGGSQLIPNGTDGLALKVHGANHFALDFDGSEAGFLARNLPDAVVLGYCSFVRGDTWWISPGLNIQTGALRMAGTQVVTTRQTGTAANATDLATALTLVNDLKAKLVAHGLIS